MKARRLFLSVVFILGVMSYSTVAYAEWHFGIGTGLFNLHAEGDEGFHTNLTGPVVLDVDLDPDDFQDVAETALGLGGYATDGTWLIKYSFGVLKLEDDASTTLASGTTVRADLDYDITVGELMVGYPVLSRGSFTLRAEGGVRYIGHDIDLDVTVNSIPLDLSIDEDWTDFLVGLSLAVPFAEKWSWDSHVNYGFGGSEGTFGAQTGISRQFLTHWSATLYGNYTAIDFENGSKGDTDWYLYDVDEYGLGLSILFNW
jgi:hypothetical protein